MTIRMAILGDRDERNPNHAATEAALDHAAHALGAELDAVWFGTESLLDADVRDGVACASGVFCTTGSPYRSFDGALLGIRLAREQKVPFLGTCAGFQHVVIEYARNVLGFGDAAHGEYEGAGSEPLIAPLACSLAGKSFQVEIVASSRSAACYRARQATEQYYCSYGIDPAWQRALHERGLPIAGTSDDGAPRIFELPDHPFFVATLFVPQARSTPDQPHPLVLGLVRAALARGA